MRVRSADRGGCARNLPSHARRAHAARLELGAAVGVAPLALCPFIVLTTAASLVQRDLLHDLQTSKLGVQLAAGLSNAAYAFERAIR